MVRTSIGKRFNFIDSCRGLAVILAMFGHAWSQFIEGTDGLDTLNIVRVFFTRTATPVFMILFGMMIELAYLKRLREGRVTFPEVQRRLYGRMLLCYLLFVAITFMAVLTGKLTAMYGTGAILYMNSGRFGVILKLYAVYFVLIALTLPPGRRYGSSFYLAMAALGWGLRYIAIEFNFPTLFPFRFLFGNGSGFGPSILPGLTFIATGIAFGEILSGRRSALRGAILVALSMAVMAFGMWGTDAFELLYSTVTIFRWTNSPYYYAFGIIACSLYLVGYSYLWRRSDKPGKPISMEFFGAQTLFYYGFGNIAINTLPIHDGNSLIGLVYVALFTVGLMLATYKRMTLLNIADRISAGAASRFGALYSDLSSALSNKLVRLTSRKVDQA